MICLCHGAVRNNMTGVAEGSVPHDISLMCALAAGWQIQP